MTPADRWSSGDAYEPYVGRWSRLIARAFLDWLAISPGAGWSDIGCGTGALSQAILERGAPRQVVGIDPSDDYLQHARARLTDPRTSFRLGDAQNLPAADAEFDAVVSGLVLNFVPDARRAVSEMRRITRPGGTVAAYVWDYAGRMECMRYFWDAAVALDPGAVELDEGRRFPLATPTALADLFTAAGCRAVASRAVDVPTVFEDFQDYWSPFLGGQGPAPGYCMALPEERRAALRERLEARLPLQPDGRIHLTARAWAVKGTTP